MQDTTRHAVKCNDEHLAKPKILDALGTHIFDHLGLRLKTGLRDRASAMHLEGIEV